MDDGKKIEHPAFGKASISICSGSRPLFMVDHPQQHFVILTVSRASLERRLSNDYVYDGEEVIQIAFSEVQWARFITTPNTTGVPCTMDQYFDRKTGKYTRTHLEDDYSGKKEAFIAEVKETAEDASKALAEAMALMKKMLAGGSLKKGDLQAVAAALETADREFTANLPFVVEQAGEAIETAVESGKAEIEAHAEFTLTRIGERALGSHLAGLVGEGADPKEIGRLLAESVTKQK